MWTVSLGLSIFPSTHLLISLPRSPSALPLRLGGQWVELLDRATTTERDQRSMIRFVCIDQKFDQKKIWPLHSETNFLTNIYHWTNNHTCVMIRKMKAEWKYFMPHSVGNRKCSIPKSCYRLFIWLEIWPVAATVPAGRRWSIGAMLHGVDGSRGRWRSWVGTERARFRKVGRAAQLDKLMDDSYFERFEFGF